MTLPFELNKVHCVDCLEAMRLLPDKSIDLVLTDPPYGIGKKWVGGFSDKHGWGSQKQEKDIRNAWDMQVPSSEVFTLLLAKGKNSIVWGGNYFYLPLSRCWLLWVKPERGFTLAEAEMAWTSFDNVVRVWEGNRHVNERNHPTQKPVALFRWILEKYTKPDDLILDPFMGSGTTGVAAIQTGRRFLGFEISPEYCKLANDRCEAARQGLKLSEYRDGQQTLFGGAE